MPPHSQFLNYFSSPAPDFDELSRSLCMLVMEGLKCMTTIAGGGKNRGNVGKSEPGEVRGRAGGGRSYAL